MVTDEASTLPDDSQTTAPPPPASGTFIVDEFVTLPEGGGPDDAVREDDALLVRATLRATGGAATGFVTLLIDDEVVWTRNVQLQDGASTSIEHVVEDLRGREQVGVTLRALGVTESSEVIVHAWPRVGDVTAVDGLGFIVRHAKPDEPNGTRVVNATFWSNDGRNFSSLDVRLLCVAADGAVTASDAASAAVPNATDGSEFEASFVECGAGTSVYGVALDATRPDGLAPIRARVLAVPVGWTAAAGPDA